MRMHPQGGAVAQKPSPQLLSRPRIYGFKAGQGRQSTCLSVVSSELGSAGHGPRAHSYKWLASWSVQFEHASTPARPLTAFGAVAAAIQQ